MASWTLFYFFSFDKGWRRRFLIFRDGIYARAIVEARSRAAFSKRQARDAIWKLRQAASAHFIKRSFVETAEN